MFHNQSERLLQGGHHCIELSSFLGIQGVCELFLEVVTIAPLLYFSCAPRSVAK